jgi:sugar lactone lactonase YvrE
MAMLEYCSSIRGVTHRPAQCLARFVGFLLLSAVASFTTFAQSRISYTFSATTAVGQSSAAVVVPMTMVSSGTALAPRALTLGVANAEFTVDAGTCTTGATYSIGQQCNVSVVFNPKYPGVRSGAVELLNSDGKLLASTLIAGIATGSLSVLNPGLINTVAGDKVWIYQQDGVLATDAPIFLPMGVAVDAAGNLFLADSNNNRIRRVDGQTKIISTVAGNGTPGYAGDGGLATSAMISNPGGVALDGAGNLYFADSNNDVIRRVDAVSGVITTVAGIPQIDGSSGNGGLATLAMLSKPEGIAVDPSGNLYVADTGNHAIRKVNATTGYIVAVAGTGAPGYNGDNILATEAELNGPWDISLGPDGSLYIADTTNQRVRRVTAATGLISTLAGTGTQGYSGDGAAATMANLNAPAAVALDPAGNLYIADSGNNRVRQISSVTGNIQTLAGTSTEGFSGDGGPANLANMYGPYSLFFDQSGNLFFSDMFNNRVREIYSSEAVMPTYPEMRVGKISAPQIEGLVNDGNADLTVGTPTFVNAALDSATTTCNVGSILSFNEAGNSCNFGVEFAPTSVGQDILGTVTVPSDAGDSPGIINLSGQVLSVQPSSVLLSSSQNPSFVHVAVTFTATISAGGDATTGTVSFFDNGNPIAGCSNVAEGSNQAATCTTSALPLGSSTITAAYSGDANDASNTSPSIVQVVKQSPSIMLVGSPNPVVVDATVTLTATVVAPTGTPTGTITFYNGTTPIGSANLTEAGTASFSTASLAVGTESLTAKYSGDSINTPVTSSVLSEVVEQASTTTTLSSSSSIVTVGTTVTFAAFVASTNGPAPEGTVQFTNGASLLGSASLSSGGMATLSLSSLPPGTYSVVATYIGDTDDAKSSSSSVTETIQQIPTTTVLTANANPISAGATLNLSVVVTPSGNDSNVGVLSGNITFSEGTTVYGIVAINSTGDTILPLTTLSAGSHVITASYAGNTNYASSSSAVLNEIVLSTATMITLSSPTTTTLAGEPASFIAVVSSSTATPSGTVAFQNGGVNIGQAQLNAEGSASFSTTTLPVGVSTITAIYSGSQNYNTSTSSPLQHTVVLAKPSVVLIGPLVAVNAGTTFALSANLTSNGGAPTGTMSLLNGGATMATQVVSGDGTFSFANLSLPVGTYQLSATYSGDSDNAPATSAPFTLTVQLTPTVTSLVSSANPSTLGQSVTFTATSNGGTPTPTGLIELLDGTSVLGSSSLGSNGVATLTLSTLTFGAHLITASYQGDKDHASSTSLGLNEKVVSPVVASMISSPNPSIFGEGVTFSVKIAGTSSPVPTGSVIFRFGNSSLSTMTLDQAGAATLETTSLPVGSDVISVTYSGDINYAGIITSVTQTVQSATTKVSLTANQNPVIYGTAVMLSSTVTGNGGVIQAGVVNFSDAGSPIGSSSLNSDGVATLTLATLGPGSHSIVANFVGNSEINASSSVPQIILVKELTSTTLTSSANPSPTLSSIVLTATVTNSGIGMPTGVVTFLDGSSQLGNVALNADGIASLTIPSLSAGNHPITASYGGDVDNFAGVSSTLTEGVQLRPTATSLSSSATDPNNPLEVTVIAVITWSGPASPTGTVTFTSGTTVLGSSPVNSIGLAILNFALPSSAINIMASYSGDIAYAGSRSLSTSVSGGTATQFTMQLNPPSLTLHSKQHAMSSLTLTSLEGFSDTLQLGCLGLPASATCTFSASQEKLAANGTVTVQLAIDTGDPLGAGSMAALGKRSTNGILLCLLPCLFCFGVGARAKKVRTASLMLLLCVVPFTTVLVGCSGLTIHGTPPGTYSFKVTASGVESGATVFQTMTLTVAQ